MDEGAVLDLVGKLYDAAYDRSLWRDYLESLRAHTNSVTAYLVVVDPTGEQAGLVEGPLLSSEADRQYQAYYHKVDLWADAYELHGPGPGRVWGSHQLVPDAVMAASEWHNDLLRPLDCFYCAGGILFQDRPAMIGMGVLRSRRQGPADDPTMRLLAALMTHQRQALRIDGRLRQLEAVRGMSGDLIDGLPYGLIVLDRRRRVLAMNRMAEKIVVAAAGLRMDSGGLAGLRPREELLLQAALGRASAATPSATTLVLPRPTNAQPLRVVVAPVSRSATPLPFVFPAPAVLLFLHDPTQLAEPSTGLLRRLYDLTPREAELAGLLAAGAGLDAVSDALGIAKRTAVNHLQRIFRKTGTHRQTELIKLLSSVPNVTRLEDGST